MNGMKLFSAGISLSISKGLRQMIPPTKIRNHPHNSVDVTIAKNL